MDIIEQINNEALKSKLETPIEELEISIRAYNRLKRANINTILDIIQIKNMNDIENLDKKNTDELYKKLLEYEIDLDDKEQCQELIDKYKNEDIEKVLQLTIEDLDVSTGVFNGVKRAGINTAYDVVERENLKSIRNFGPKRFEELKQKFLGYGIDLDDRIQCNELIKKYDALNPKEDKEEWEQELELEDSNNVLEEKVEEKIEILKGLKYQLKRKQQLELKLLECDEEFKKLMKQYELLNSKESDNKYGTK